MKKLAIIGAGASGLCAAIEAKKANPNIDITIFERMQKSGKKILATGNGRCNFTNSDLSLNHFYGNDDFLKAVLSRECSDIKDFFKNLRFVAEGNQTSRFRYLDTCDRRGNWQNVRD